MNTPNPYSNTQKSMNKQSGLSLIELLIAMVVGLFLLVGITTSYLSSKKSSITRDQISILEDNGRVALEILTETIQHTGYRSKGLAVLENSFMTKGSPASYSCGTGFNSVKDTTLFPTDTIKNSDASNDVGDTIGITYLGDEDLFTDCAGEPLPEECRVGAGVDLNAHQIHNTFFIDGDNNLQCAGSRTDELVPIAENVENIQVLYGINADDDPSNSVERYVNADDVGVDNWGLVVSVQVAILVRTPLEVKEKAETQSFSLLDVKVDTPNDRYQRAVFSATINLRNI